MKSKLLILILFAAVLAGCQLQQEPEPDLQTIRLPMGFVPNIQYAPFYVAVEKGYFAEAGIQVDFDYSFETDGVKLVGANETQFALVSGEQVLLARAQDIPVVYVVAWFQKYPVAVVAKADSGINSIEDLAGRRVGLPGPFGATYVGLRALLNKAGLAETDLILDSIGFNQVEALATDREEAVVGYFSNEPVQLRAQGYEVVEFRVADYVSLASNGIITNEETIEENPDLVEGFVKAFLRGLADTIANPEKAYTLSLNYVEGLQQGDAVQMQVLTDSIPFWNKETLGHSDRQSWQNMEAVLREIGLLEGSLDIFQAYSNDFIK